jgi:hypothetical protein
MRRLAMVLALWGFAGCRSETARPEDCSRIFDKLVEVELHELGFRDPALAIRKRADLQKILGAEIARCAGGRMRADALACVDHAHTAEEIVHGCLE